MRKIDHQKPAKYEHLAFKEHEKLIFCIFLSLLGPPRTPSPSGALAPERPKGPYTRAQAYPKALWGQNLSPNYDFSCKLKRLA